MNIEDINRYYSDNKSELHYFFSEVENTIDGRICHTSIILLKIITEIEKIESYLEIGVHNGGSISLLLDSKDLKFIYGIDLFEDVYSLEKHYNFEKYKTYQYFQRDNLSFQKTMNNLNLIQKKLGNYPEINLIQGNSYFDETENKIKKKLHANVDLLHIDGDHTIDGVKNDFGRYFKFVKIGGFLVFDDYHHPIIKEYVDSLDTDSIQKIGKFKSDNTDAEQFLIRRLK